MSRSNMQAQYEAVYKPHGVTRLEYSKFVTKFYGALALWAFGTLVVAGPNFLILLAGWGVIIYAIGYKQDPADLKKKERRALEEPK